ncbi:SLBB domain-containing protein [Intestinibacter bartlettii]|uniref:SLBB domain-containing protein n=1 Tax=Intestinibacter bartlettii TaxID=261299 RepID=A0ABS6DTG8_9FIRM|nr:SLBB domain-containing protein [Intestinibacter bartlettii]MBU5335059.1 SLBB domain-containing protein [Intestinibacter bartlettii]MDO5009374.1 SLBB domain-containing protein [Intestinibacter bartlettii]
MEKDLLSLIKKAGIVGAGGAGFPTHAKLNAKAEYVIINGAECEPLLRVDQQLMALHTKEILDALNLVVEHVGATHGVVALKSKYKEAISSVKSIIGNYDKLQLHELENFYPAGDEQVLVYEVTGRIVPEGGIPLNVGAIVSNVETMLNIYNAYYYEKPVTDKYVTVTGEVNNTKTFKLPIGMTVREAIDLAGGTNLSDFVVINGGPMMGRIVDIDSTITKTTKGLIVLPKDHSLVKDLQKDVGVMLKDAKTSCMHCSHCSEVCPRGLIGHAIQPHKMMRIASYGSLCDNTISTVNAYLCCGCRLCEYACIMNLQPWKLNNLLKQTMKQNNIKNTCNNKPEKAHPFREFKRYPVSKLIRQLGLAKFDKKSPLEDKVVSEDKVTILMSQHIGKPCEAVVNVGDTVEKGDLIGMIDDNSLGSNIHASISGVVKEVEANKVVIVSEK